MIFRRLLHSLPRINTSPFASSTLTPAIIALPPAPALSKWFVPGEVKRLNLDHFQSMNEDPLVEVEWTNTNPEAGDDSFRRLEIPISMFLAYLNSPSSLLPPSQSLYLAQCAPPQSLLPDLPTPSIINTPPHSFSHSSLWLGLSPTATPLHRDPNHNILYQLSGSKRLRLWPPSDGLPSLQNRKIRGEEMMRLDSVERIESENAVWGEGEDMKEKEWRERGWETELKEGEAVFIPEGWWHAVRGMGEKGTLSASVNWWFR